jgi:hypothetical protein
VLSEAEYLFIFRGIFEKQNNTVWWGAYCTGLCVTSQVHKYPNATYRYSPPSTDLVPHPWQLNGCASVFTTCLFLAVIASTRNSLLWALSPVSAMSRNVKVRPQEAQVSPPLVSDKQAL